MSTDLASRQHLAWDACYNARDVGGYATTDGATTRWRALVRSDSPVRLTHAGQEALRDYGITTVIDLRHAEELALNPSPYRGHRAETHRLTYVHAPLTRGSDRATVAMVDGSASLQLMYQRMIDHFRPGIAAIMATIGDAADGGVLIHCHIGKDRTGLITALSLALAGVPDEVIIADYALSEQYLRPLFDEWLDAEADDAHRARARQWLNSDPDLMRGVLEHLQTRYGGAEAYLLAAGVTAEQIERIRSRLRDEA